VGRDFHGVGDRAAGRAFTALITSIDVLSDHVANLFTKNPRMVTQGNFHQALPCAGKVVYSFYREQLATSYDLPHKQKIADFGMPIAEFLNRNSELNFSYQFSFLKRHAKFH
jgi:hypothetical protein